MPGLLIDKKDLVKFNIKKLLNINFPSTRDSLGIIILVKQSQFNHLNKLPYGKQRIEYIQSNDFLKNIYQYYYVFYNKDRKIIEIREYIDKSEHLMEIMETIENYVPKDVTIWTGLIPPEESEKYIKCGFNHPYICQSSPLKHKFSKQGIAFLKTNIPEPISDESVKNKLLYAKETANKSLCELYARFTPQAIKYLQEINDPKQKNQKELSGSLFVSNVVKKDHKIVFELSSVPNSVISGVEEEVDAVWSRYNFHTHPKKAYVNHNVKRGWPSSQDYVGFIELNNHTIFHTVVTLEGIYIISFNPEWIGKISSIDKKYVLNHYDISHHEKISFEEYVNIINSKKYKNKPPLFIVKYMSWNNSTKIFPIFYAKTNGSCLTSDKQFNIHKNYF